MGKRGKNAKKMEMKDERSNGNGILREPTNRKEI